MSLSYIFDRLLIRFEKFVRWFKPNDEEIRPGIRKPTDLMVDEYAEGDGIDVAKEFFSARMLIDDPAYFDKHIQPCINRLLKELILSCLEDEEHPMWGYCEFANEFTEWIDNQKAMYVKRLRDDSGNIVTQHSSLTTIDVIVELDYMINEYAPLFFRNHFPIPKRVANWKPFLSDRVFHLYKQVIREGAQVVGSELETFVKDSASDLNPDMGGLMDWKKSVDVLTKKQEEVYRVLDSPEAEPQPTYTAWSGYEPKEAEEKREEDKISEDTVGDVLNKVQSGGELTSADEQVLEMVKNAKSGTNLSTFRSNFIIKTFRPKYEPIISALVDDGDFNKDVPVDWALEQVECNSWFNEFVIRSILGNCRGRGEYAHRFKPRSVVRRPKSNRTTDALGNPVEGRLEKDFPPKSAGGKWTPEPSTDNPNWYKVDCLVVMAPE